MPLPIATIGLSLAAAGLKIFGPENKMLEFAAHPLDLLTGHLLAENAEELTQRLRDRFRLYERVKNEDLDRAVTRSAFLGSLLCLLDGLPTQHVVIGPWSQLRNRFKEWMPQRALQGAISQGEESSIRLAIETCVKRMKGVQDDTFVPTEIDPIGLVLPERGGDWGGKLAGEALADIRIEHPNLPNRLDAIFQQRWFSYMCLAFQEQIKTDERVSNIFQTVQSATGLGKALFALQVGEQLGMPLSRPMPVFGSGVAELRVRGEDGQYGAFYSRPVMRVLWWCMLSRKRLSRLRLRKLS